MACYFWLEKPNMELDITSVWVLEWEEYPGSCRTYVQVRKWVVSRTASQFTIIIQALAFTGLPLPSHEAPNMLR